MAGGLHSRNSSMAAFNSPAFLGAIMMERLREAYTTAFDQIMDRVLSEVLLPNDKSALCADAAQFFTYLMAIKIVVALVLALAGLWIISGFLRALVWAGPRSMCQSKRCPGP